MGEVRLQGPYGPVMEQEPSRGPDSEYTFEPLGRKHCSYLTTLLR